MWLDTEGDLAVATAALGKPKKSFYEKGSKENVVAFWPAEQVLPRSRCIFRICACSLPPIRWSVCSPHITVPANMQVEGNAGSGHRDF